jgi:protein-S-isoprenylcysteine O-methyltransferase Ste14
MVRIGILLIVFGVGSLLLPMFDLQFRLMSLLDDFQPAAGIIVAGIGGLLVIIGMRNRPAATTMPSPASENVAPPSA